VTGTAAQALWTSNARNVKVIGGEYYNSGEGVWFSYGSQYCTAIGVTVHNNTGSGFLFATSSEIGHGLIDCVAYGNDGYGILIRGINHQIIGGHFFENGRDGIRVYADSGPISNVKIIGAEIYNNGKGEVWPYQYGIVLDGHDYPLRDCTVEDNTIYDDQATPTQIYGIREVGDADYNKIV